MLNKIEEQICHNSQSKRCNYDQQAGDQDPEYLEVTLSELKESRSKWTDSKKTDKVKSEVNTLFESD